MMAQIVNCQVQLIHSPPRLMARCCSVLAARPAHRWVDVPHNPGQRGGEAGKAAADDHPIVLGRAAPADESDPPARPERASHMGERPCRIVEEHHPETREQDVVLYFPFSETTPYVRRRCLKLGPNCDPESIYAWTQSAG